MGTLKTHADLAAIKIRDLADNAPANILFSEANRMAFVNDILERIYYKLVFAESELVYAEGTITTVDTVPEYTPSFTHNGFLRDGVWLDGEDWYLAQVSEAAKVGYDSNAISSTSEVVNGDFEDWTSGDADNWTDSTSAVSDEETSSSYGGCGSSMKLTATGAASQYIQSDAITVTADQKYWLRFRYKNTADDVAQYAVYDVSNSADIVSATDLDSTTSWSAEQNIGFVTPTGCTSIYIRLYAKTDGDIVWFDNVWLATGSTFSEPEAYYIAENGDVGFLWVPDDAYTVHVQYWEPITQMSTYATDTLPWGGIFNQYIQRMLIFEMKEILEMDNSRDALMAEIELGEAMNMVYARGVRKRRQVSDMFSVGGI